MRKLAVAVALASTALASPAMARDNSWYVGVGGGVMIVEDIDLDIGTVANAGTLDHRTGYDFEGTVGYDFGGFRAEVESSTGHLEEFGEGPRATERQGRTITAERFTLVSFETQPEL